jgi:hypothetical protein
MLHYRKAHISIRDYAPDGCEWERKQVIVRPLPMRQEIHDAMGELYRSTVFWTPSDLK